MEQLQNLLEKAKADAEKATGAKLDSLNEKIEALAKELEEGIYERAVQNEDFEIFNK